MNNTERTAEPHTLVALASYLADLWLAQSKQLGVDETEKEEILEKALSWILQGQNMLPDVQEDLKTSSRAPLNFIQAEILHQMNKAEETIQLCDFLLSGQDNNLEPQDKANIQYLLAITLSAKCLENKTTEGFERAKDMYVQAMKITTNLGNDLMAVNCIKALVSTCCELRRMSVEISFVTSSEILGWVGKWEEIWEEIRTEASVFRGLQGLQVKQRIRERNSATLYMAAIKSCIEENNTREAWRWAQKAKARAVVDSLGLSRAIPQHLSQSLSDESKLLLEREQVLLDEIDTAAQGWRYHLRREHLELRRVMSTRPDLRAIQAIRQGGYLDVNELESMFRGEKNVVCVDWVELADEKYHILTVRPGETPRYFATNVLVQDVRSWLDCYIFGDESQSNLDPAAPEELEALCGLVSPLSNANVTTDDDLLVFVPTGILCSVPLHALQLSRNGETRCIIEQNPVIYSNALAIFRQILARSAAMTSTEPDQQFQAAFFGDPTPKESAESEMVLEVGKHLNADIFIGEGARGEALLAAFEKYNLIHYQGHAEFHSADILQNSVLKLYDQDVSVHSLFETTILQSPHISLVACQSGQQSLSVGDEPLGFLTALTIAGAGSVLGTLWNLDDKHASSVFTEHFYNNLAPNIQMRNQSFIFDLALALQKTVCTMRKRAETKRLYCWVRSFL